MERARTRPQPGTLMRGRGLANCSPVGPSAVGLGFPVNRRCSYRSRFPFRPNARLAVAAQPDHVSL
eukprot:6345693-Pyramimonas_sp.AAC.1